MTILSAITDSDPMLKRKSTAWETWLLDVCGRLGWFRRRAFAWVPWVWVLLPVLHPIFAQGQPVIVTVSVDTNILTSGQSTMLRVQAQVVPELRTNFYQIFSWYVDVLNTNGSVGVADYDAMTRTASDNDPATSSGGVSDGAHRRGIYDTFIELPMAGVHEPVELMAIPVMGQSGGMTRFEVGPGSGAIGLAGDFFVGPTLNEGTPLIGGDYAQAFVDVEVIQDCSLELGIERVNGGGPGQPLNLVFVPCVGYDHTVEFANELTSATVWNPLPGAPHNAGTVTVTNAISPRFFRVRADSQ